MRPPAAPTAPRHWMLLGLALALTAWPGVRDLGAAYPHNHQGEIQAWSAKMATSMEVHGFLECRFMPHLDLHPDTRFPDFRWYVTHPVLDVVIRAVLVRVFGPSEATMRYQGVAGGLIASLALFFLVRVRLGSDAALVAAIAMTASPLWGELVQLSVYHAPCLGLGTAALALQEGWRRRPGRGGLLLLFGLLALALQMDWPGYFFALLVWIRALRPVEGRRDPRLLFGIPALCVGSLAVLWAHVDLLVATPGFFLESLAHARSHATGAHLFSADGLRQTLRFQIDSFGGYGIAIVLAALAAALGDRRRRDRLALWGQLFALGALNVLVFPAKAPAHDFWGAYWLPLVGFSWGLTFEALAERIAGFGPRGTRTALLVATCLGLAFLARSHSGRPEGWPDGAMHRELAQAVAASIPPEDRAILVSTASGLAPKLLSAYLGAEVLPVAVDDLPTFEKLPIYARIHLPHLRGRPCLVFVPGALDEGGALHRARLVAYLRRVGRPYDAAADPAWFDVTDWLWAD